jgi:hypothetical protein
MAVKAIDTQYRGYLFRSRLEARWAIFFDTIGIEWEYEPEGYTLSTGERYLPDFWLPRFCDPASGVFVEVKPRTGDDAKAQQLARDSGHSVLLLVGTPAFKPYTLFDSNGNADFDAVFMSKYLPGGSHSGEYRMFYASGWGGAYAGDLESPYARAVAAARSARFEHGADQPRL